MLDFLGNTASVVISVVIIGGFLALGALIIFEIGTMALFWIKHSFRDSANGLTPVKYRRKWSGKKSQSIRQP